MNTYLLLLHENVDQIKNLSPRELEELANSYTKWSNKLEKSGHLVSGDGLEDTSIKVSGISSVVNQSPSVESKTIIGGYYLLKAIDLKSVIDLTKECPCHLSGGTTEIRPIMRYNY